ncbi:hypothetical protein BT93_H0971 [Corymbia citriodora subsp. variegata]|nr:hypothetical protein BT93_H0971 [Corymbia citriodora subsp. variegata]
MFRFTRSLSKLKDRVKEATLEKEKMLIPISGRNLHGRTFSLLQARLFSHTPEAAAAAAAAVKWTSEPKPIEKILIANRGEIACRIMRTVRRLGVRTIAIYSDADAGVLHLTSANEAIRIGLAPARLSYLIGASIINAALRAGAQVRGRELTICCLKCM